MAKRPFWCGWEVPDGLPLEDFAESWPDDMRGWCSGYGEDHQTYVGMVFAEDADAARDLVLSCYGRHAAQIGERWEPHEAGPEAPSESGRWLGEDEWFAAKMQEHAA